jgi:GntR family transcriptional repressor for pyruvate dehydrogenase complex
MEEHSSGNNNIAATIFRDLRRQILRSELAPGERLPGERELASKYGTNRNTLREAVRKLEQSRLVTVRHGQGVTVADFRKTGTMELLSPFLETAPEPAELAHILGDILPARLLVLEFASRLAVQRADKNDIQRLRDITDLLIAAFERGDPVVIAHGFQRWLDTMIDAGHSVAIRWIANPFLEAYRDLLDRFPMLWVLEPSFPQHLRDFLDAIEQADEERAIEVTKTYYKRVDAAFMRAFAIVIAQRERAGVLAGDAKTAGDGASRRQKNDKHIEKPNPGS